MIRVVSYGKLKGIDAPGLCIRDHFRGTPENAGTPHFGLGPMRVLADTAIAARRGFPMHGHRDFEIVTFVCAGTVAHEDTTGASGRLGPGDVQAMTTGSGIMHSEGNPGDVETRVYQMWFHAATPGLPPAYTDLNDPPRPPPGGFTVYASGAPGIAGIIRIHQDAAVMGADLRRGETAIHPLAPGRSAYVLAVDGPISVNDTGVPARGGAEVNEEAEIRIRAAETPSRAVLIDVPATFAGPAG